MKVKGGLPCVSKIGDNSNFFPGTLFNPGGHVELQHSVSVGEASRKTKIAYLGHCIYIGAIILVRARHSLGTE